MSKTVEMKQFLKVRGANEHNLNNVDINSKETSLRMIKQGFDMKYKSVE